MNSKAPQPPPDDTTAKPSAPPPPPPRRRRHTDDDYLRPTCVKPVDLPPPPPSSRDTLSALPVDVLYRLADEIAEALSVGGRAQPNRLRVMPTHQARGVILDKLASFDS